MRQIEQNMIEAIRDGRDWKQDNTCVEFAQHVGNPYLAASVYLHGNQIAQVDRDGVVHPDPDTFRNWPTATTASRLRALGVKAHAYRPRTNGKTARAYIDGKPC